MNQVTINLAKDFSETPGGRFIKDGPYSGELFLNKHLIPAMQKYDVVVLNLDSTYGYPHSFLAASFGRLVDFYTLKEINSKLKLVCNEDQKIVDRIQNEYLCGVST